MAKSQAPEVKYYWYARAPNIKWMGPYKSQEEAWIATIGHDGMPVDGSSVFCTAKQLSLK